MEDNRQGRLFLAIVLSLGVWMGINYYFFPSKPQPKKETSQNTGDKDTTPKKDSKVSEKEVALPKEVKKPVVKTSIQVVKPEDIKTRTIKTSSFLIRFSNLGGRIEKFYVRNYKDLNGKEVKIVKSPADAIEFGGEKFQAIEISREKGMDFNFTSIKDEVAFPEFNKVLFAESFNEEALKITYEAISQDKKFLLKKEYQFFPEENYFRFSYSVTNKGKERLALAQSSSPLYFRSFPSLGPVKPGMEIPEREQMHYFRFYFMDGSFKDSIDTPVQDGFLSGIFGGNDPGKDKRFDLVVNPNTGIDFLGTGSRYFIAVLDPLDHKPAGILTDNRKGNETGMVAVYDNIALNQGESASFSFASYVGIREADGMAFRKEEMNPFVTQNSPLRGLSDKLDKSFNQGITTPFRNGIVWMLKKLYDWTIPNYGWCIIIFAILFKVVFYPLNQKQAESMKKMQELNPQVKELNEKYAKDPQVRQQKIMELYKKNNTSPMSGCLPMVIQIPIFIALYTAFSDTIDLWKTPFLWISDLSEPDTVYSFPAMMGITGITLNVLPLIMVGSQVIQTKMTSVSADPNQKTMMYLMPVIMLYFFWSMPSGVTLYWTFQNFLSIGQQFWTNKFGPESKKKKS